MMTSPMTRWSSSRSRTTVLPRGNCPRALLGQQVLHVTLDGSPQRARPHGRVVAHIHEQLPGLRSEGHADLAVLELLLHRAIMRSTMSVISSRLSLRNTMTSSTRLRTPAGTRS